MPRFQLLVRESNREPRVVPITQLVVVGRSKKADVAIEDDEVGREQFRIGPAGSAVRIEGIGRTNKTTVDGKALDAGDQVTVPAGATIKVGKTVFVVQLADATDASSVRPGDLEGTMVAGPRTAPRGSDQEATGNATNPNRPAPAGNESGIERTMAPGRYRPGQPSTESPPPAPFPNLTMPLKPGRATPPTPPTPATPAAQDDVAPNLTMPLKPGRATPPAPPAPPSAGDVAPNLTMPLKPGRATPPAAPNDEVPNVTMPLRPGRTAPPPANDDVAPNLTMPLKPGRATPPPRADDVAPNVTMPLRPGRGGDATPPPAPAPRAPEPPPPAATPAAPAASSTTPGRPKTVMMGAAELAAASGLSAAELESRLHQCNARLVVKGDGIKRRVRLLKVRTKVGRAENADVLLPAESVSEQHADVVFDGLQWSLQDNGSTNGSMVDGQALRGNALPIRRDSLLGFGSLRAIFLGNDPATAAVARTNDARALRQLVANGRLAKDVAKQIQEMAAADPSQSMAELLLLNTPIEAVDWHAAVGAARNHVPFLARLLRLFGLGKKPAS